MELVKQLKEDRSKIHPLNRAQLIVDSHVLAVDSKLAIEIPIEMTTYLSMEDDPLVLMVALNQFKRFYMALTEKSRPAYKVSDFTNIKCDLHVISIQCTCMHFSNFSWDV